MSALAFEARKRSLLRWLEGRFALSARGSSVRQEVVAGLTTFMTMSYIVFVNPQILSGAGVPKGPAIAATAALAALTTLIMGLASNYPLAMASGMGINAAVAYGMVKGSGLSWQAAMGVIVLEGLVVTALTAANVRDAVYQAIPVPLKRGIGVGIGLFLAFIGLKNARFVLPSAVTTVTYNAGLLRDPVALVAIAGLVVTAALMARKVKGAILLGIVASTALAVLTDLTFHTRVMEKDALSSAAHLVAWPSFATVGRFDLRGALTVTGLSWVFAMVMTDFFDTMGTVVAVGREAGFADEQGRIPGLKRVFLADGVAAVLGGIMGASSSTTYIESGAGAAEGGRTGLTAVTVALCFALAVFFSPLIGLVPEAATAPALVIVGFLMLSGLAGMEWGRLAESLPAFLTMLGIPLSFSIARGIGYGMVLCVILKLLTGRIREIRWPLWVFSGLFLAAWLLGR